jgi:glycosyltransferase involved in cell wall biosynthesis
MKITIITVCYNSETHLRSTIESVLHQTYQDIEYIIVDGNSQDRTVSIIRDYETEFAGRLKWISEPDKGIYDAMNKGIRMATGDVIGILNSDDFYTSESVIKRLVNEFERKEIDAVYGDVHYVNNTDLSRPVRYYSSRFFCPGLMRFGYMPAHPSFYCKRSVYEKYGLYNISYKVAADFEMLLRLLYIHRITTSYLPMDFVTMRTGGASSSGLQSHKQIFHDHLRALKANNIYSNRFLLGQRYIFKMGEILTYKIYRHVKTTNI